MKQNCRKEQKSCDQANLSNALQWNEDCILSLSSNWGPSKLQIAIAGVNRSALTTWSAPSIPPSSPSMSRFVFTSFSFFSPFFFLPFTLISYNSQTKHPAAIPNHVKVWDSTFFIWFYIFNFFYLLFSFFLFNFPFSTCFLCFTKPVSKMYFYWTFLSMFALPIDILAAVDWETLN